MFPCIAADTAKSITTQARVNTGETNKIIKELIAEKERLLKELQDKKGLVQGYTEEGKYIFFFLH